jgi:hypothetical protein
MQLNIDLLSASSFQLSAAAEFLQKLAAGPQQSAAVTRIREELREERARTEAPVSGNDASTDIPPAPASASPESTQTSGQNLAPAAPSDTPAVSVSAAEAVANAGPLDSAGFPWDVRIHTANKAKIGDGTYRKKPGVDANLVLSVRAEWTNLSAQAAPAIPDAPNVAAVVVPDVPESPAATGAIPAAPAPQSDAPAVVTLTAQDVLTRCTEIQMADASKGAALFQAIVGAGVPAGPMGLMAITDPAVLAAALAAVNAV